MRRKVQEFILSLLEDEITELMAREKSERRRALDSPNPVESPFAPLRLRTNAAKLYKKVANATAVTWKMLLIAEHRFRKLDAPEKLKEVYLGIDTINLAELKQEEALAIA